MRGIFVTFLLTAVLLHVPRDVYLYVIDGDQNVNEFTYDIDPANPYGVYNWPSSYRQSCAGSLQSPIHIQSRYTRYNAKLPCPSTYNSFMMKGELKNNGQTVKFEPYGPRFLTMINAPYRPGTYELHELHVHYGGHVNRITGHKSSYGTLKPGSEHTVDGHRYSGEVHLVFKHVEHGTRGLLTSSERNELLVMAVFVKAVPAKYVRDKRFSRFISGPVQSVQRINDTMPISIDTSMFFGKKCDYYTYPGSKTTPSCSQNVRWIVMKSPIHVTKSAWYTLTNIHSRGDFVWYYGNYRNGQSYNGRMVETNSRPNWKSKKYYFG